MSSDKTSCPYLPPQGFPTFPNIAEDATPKCDLDRRLYKAIESENISEVQSLLKEGADPNTFHPSYEAALHTAILTSPPNGTILTRILLEAGANPNLLNPLHERPLEKAVMFVVPVEICRLLIQHGASVDEMGNGGTRSLHVISARTGAVVFGKPSEEATNNARAIFDLLIESGADVNQVNEELETPLHFAARTGGLYAVEKLIDLGADAHVVSAHGKTPLTLAKETSEERRNQMVIQMLENAPRK